MNALYAARLGLDADLDLDRRRDRLGGAESAASSVGCQSTRNAGEPQHGQAIGSVVSINPLRRIPDGPRRRAAYDHRDPTSTREET